MDFGVLELDEDLQAFREEVSRFYDEHLPPAVVAAERGEGNGVVPELERALARAGWVDPSTGAGADGAELDDVRLAIVDAEEGRRAGSLLPVKGSTRLVLGVVRAFGSDALRAEVLAGTAAGTATCSLGYTEPDCGSDAAAITTRATRDGDEWSLNGQKMFSTGAHLARYVMITARTDPAAAKHRGITMFLVPTDLPGVEIQGMATLGGERTNVVFLDDVRLSDRYRLGPVNEGWKVASGALAAEHGMAHETAASPDSALLDALRSGHTGWMNELPRLHDAVLSWARVPGPEGRAPLADPLVRARLAELALAAELVAATPAPYARVVASDLFIRSAADAIDMCGAFGLLSASEPDAAAGGHLEWAHRFAQGTSIYGGTTDVQRNLIAEQYLGLPRHRGAIRR